VVTRTRPFLREIIANDQDDQVPSDGVPAELLTNPAKPSQRSSRARPWSAITITMVTTITTIIRIIMVTVITMVTAITMITVMGESTATSENVPSEPARFLCYEGGVI
jgi:hypothetical protein